MQKPPGRLTIQGMLSSFCAWSIIVTLKIQCGTVLTSWKLWRWLPSILEHPRYVCVNQPKPFRCVARRKNQLKGGYKLKSLACLSVSTGRFWRSFVPWRSSHCWRERLCWFFLSPTPATPCQETSVGFHRHPPDGQSPQHPSKQTRTSTWAASWGFCCSPQALLLCFALGVEGQEIIC